MLYASGSLGSKWSAASLQSCINQSRAAAAEKCDPWALHQHASGEKGKDQGIVVQSIWENCISPCICEDGGFSAVGGCFVFQVALALWRTSHRVLSVSSGWWPLSNPVLEREAPTIIVHPPQRSVIPGPFGKRIQERKEIIRGSCRKSAYFISKTEALSAPSGWWPLYNLVREGEAPTRVAQPPRRSVIPGLLMIVNQTFYFTRGEFQASGSHMLKDSIRELLEKCVLSTGMTSEVSNFSGLVSLRKLYQHPLL